MEGLQYDHFRLYSMGCPLVRRRHGIRRVGNDRYFKQLIMEG